LTGIRIEKHSFLIRYPFCRFIAMQAPPHINSYKFGHIVIDGISHTRDVILLPDRVIGGWWRQEGHALSPKDLEDVLAAKPGKLVIGQGAYSRMQVRIETRQVLTAHGIDFVELPTDQACEEYNRLSSSNDIAAALHLTC
jgi:hypothetical protein